MSNYGMIKEAFIQKREDLTLNMIPTPTFYNEELYIIDKFRHIQTPKAILNSLKVVESKKFPKSDLWFKEEAVSFALHSFEGAKEKGIPGEKVLPNERNMRSYPSLATLTEPMKNSYYYWRSQFLQGDDGKIMAFYLHLFVAELVNHTFNPRTAFNLSMLTRIMEMFPHETELTDFLKTVLEDLLIEADAQDLMENPHPPVFHAMGGETELYLALEAYEIQKEEGDTARNTLAKISINTWKRHFERPRKNQFFKEHRTKIYKTFKECLTVLDDTYRLHGSSLLDTLYEEKVDTKEIKLYTDLPCYRKVDPRYKRKVNIVTFSTQMAPILRNYYRLAENVTRTMLGEKRQLKLDKDVLPEDLFEKMLDHMTPKPKPKKTPPAFVHIPVEVNFDEEKISRLQQETEALVQVVEERSELEAAVPDFPPLNVPTQMEAKASMSLEEFFSKGSEAVEDEEIRVLIQQLTPLEIQFLQTFSNERQPKKEAAVYLKEKGKLLGSVLSQINEKAQESLEDNLIEEEGDELVVLEEFKIILEMIKK